MQQIQTNQPKADYRAIQVINMMPEDADNEFKIGLPEKTDRYRILALIKRLGKAAGFSARMIHLLDHYISFTRDIDWKKGARPIVFQSQQQTAFDMGLSERQIQRIENDLASVGAITWRSSGNHRRFGRRCPDTGRILFAFGIDLSPLSDLAPKLEQALEEKRVYEKRWQETKRQISWYRAQIRSLANTIDSLLDSEYLASMSESGFVRPIRTYMDLESIEKLRDWHSQLYADVKAARSAHDPDADSECSDSILTSSDVKNVAHKEDTKQGQSDKSDTGRSSISVCREATGADSANQQAPSPSAPYEGAQEQSRPTLTLKQLLNAGSQEFRALIPMETRPIIWRDITEAAYRRRGDLGISQSSWANACSTLGREGAAICILLTDRAALRETNPARRPSAYFNGMIAKGRTGELNLKASILAILKRDQITEAKS